jgi:osmoprotectant transport system permease protein
VKLLQDAYSYLLTNYSAVLEDLLIHLQLSLGALAIAMLFCIPLGIWVARNDLVAPYVMNAIGTLRVIPSLAILFLALPFLGIGFTPALFALTLLACPPILINTFVAFRGLDRAVLEAARGMGMSPWQILIQIEWPLALPVVIAGIRTAAVEVIASATLAAYIGAGGLGDYIQRGFNLRDTAILLVGALPVALLSLSAELLLGSLQKRLSPTL